MRDSSMRLRPLPRAIVLGATLSALSAVVAAAPPVLTAAWRTEAIVVDGLSNEWPQPVALERGPSVSVLNDNEFLYLLVTTTDPQIGHLLSTGLIVWLDPAGGKSQSFGVRIAGPEERPLRGASDVPPDFSSGVITNVLDRFDLLGPGKNQRRLVDMTPAMGMEFATGLTEKMITYELKLPLKKSAERLYAAGAAPGATVGLGIATPEAPRDRGRRGPLVGDSGIIGGSPYHGGGFAPFKEDDKDQKPLEIWTPVKLATEK